MELKLSAGHPLAYAPQNRSDCIHCSTISLLRRLFGLLVCLLFNKKLWLQQASEGQFANAQVNAIFQVSNQSVRKPNRCFSQTERAGVGISTTLSLTTTYYFQQL